MQHQNWAERLEHELVRRGVPARSRRRLLAELRDHADDLTDKEGLTMTDEMLNQRLGNPVELATQAAEQARRATWVGRHPVMVFALLPIPISLAVMIGVEVIVGVSFEVIAVSVSGGSDHVSRSTVVTFAYTMMWAVRYVPFVLLAALFTRLYTRYHVSRWWFGVAAVQILALAGSLISQIHSSETPGQSQHILGLALMPLPMGDGWGLPFLTMVGWIQLTQILVPVAVGGFMLWATRRRDAVWPCAKSW